MDTVRPDPNIRWPCPMWAAPPSTRILPDYVNFLRLSWHLERPFRADNDQCLRRIKCYRWQTLESLCVPYREKEDPLIFCTQTNNDRTDVTNVPNSFDVTPIGHAGQWSLLFACSSVYGQHLSASLFQHSCIGNGTIYVGKNTNLTRNRNSQMLMKCWNYWKREKSIRTNRKIKWNYKS